MYDNPNQIQAAPALGKHTGERARGFKVLADDFEHAVVCLREEITGLSSEFESVLRPEPTSSVACDPCNEQVRAPLESWLSAQLQTVKSCIDSVRGYRSRCVL